MDNTKRFLIGALAGLFIATFFIIGYGQSQKRKYLEAKGAYAVLERQYQDSLASMDEKVKAADALIAEKNERIRDYALSLRFYENAQIQLQTELAAEKEKTKALPDDALSTEINSRIGTGSSRPMGGGMFAFTRAGTEATLNRFLDGEGWAKKYEISQNTVAAWMGSSASKDGIISAWTAKYAAAIESLRACDDAKTKAVSALTALERSRKGSALKSFLWGFGSGFVTRQGLIWMGVLK